MTLQVLRVWFATKMGKFGVPDRYVDVFQGGAPRSVLAKHYTRKGLQEEAIRKYAKARLIKYLPSAPLYKICNNALM